MPRVSDLGHLSQMAPSRSAATTSVRVEASAPQAFPEAASPADGVPVPRVRLTVWNGAMFVFHAALAAVTLVVGNTSLTVPLYRTRLDFRFQNVTGDDAASGSDEGRPWVLVPLYEESGSLPFTWLVAIFFVLSALFHLLNATLLRSYYLRNLEQCYSPTRWIEYSLSAPVMIVLISYTLGVRNREVLLVQFVLVMITMPFGYWVEVVSRPKSADEWVEGSLARRLYPWVLGHVPQIAAWFVIVLTFYDGQDLTDRAPWFVHVILWVELVLFFSFGAASVVSQWYSPRFFYRGELLFQILSLVSKGVLGALLLSNVLMLSRFEELYGEAESAVTLEA